MSRWIFCVFMFMGIYPPSAEVRLGLYIKIATRCQTISSSHPEYTVPRITANDIEAEHQTKLNAGLAFTLTL
ncbi:hypothetical protein P3382_26930, partial [Vibrio parahaemolyticus]|nr:hypothetical protein [Vibrio parahaemolyticus]